MLGRCVAFAALMVGCASSQPRPPPPAPEVADDSSPLGALDDRAIPLRYVAEWNLTAGAGFDGKVDIEVDVTRPISTIWLHAKALVIDKAWVAQARTAPAAVTEDPRDAHRDGQADLIGLTVARPLERGRVNLHIEFHGDYGERVGLVRPDRGPATIFPDLEPNDARGMVPCFDEPRFKTPWAITLTVPPGLEAASNYPEKSTESLRDGRRRIVFEETRPLSTYQVAIAAGDWEESRTSFGRLPIRVLVPRGKLDRAKLATTLIPEMLAPLQSYFDEPVPYPKLDVLAIPPMEGHTGGMESPGLITIRGYLMLLPDDAPLQDRALAAEVISHELAHLWLGDLITTQSWGDLWLQEGGASWLGMEVARSLHRNDGPGPFALDRIFEKEREKGGTREPIAIPIREPRDADDLFRIETYAGGAAVFSTFEAFVGKAAFKRAMQRWVDLRRDRATTRDDFFELLAEADHTGADKAKLRAALDGMLAAQSTPTVSVMSRCDGAATAIDLSSDAAYPLPVCFRLDECVSNPALEDPSCERCVLVDGRATVPYAKCPEAIRPNPNGAALYRWTTPSRR